MQFVLMLVVPGLLQIDKPRTARAGPPLAAGLLGAVVPLNDQTLDGPSTVPMRAPRCEGDLALQSLSTAIAG